MAEPCAADNGGQSRRVCNRLAAVYPTSAVRRAVTQTVRGRAFACREVSSREGFMKFVHCVLQKEDAQNAIIRNNLDMERTLGE